MGLEWFQLRKKEIKSAIKTFPAGLSDAFPSLTSRTDRDNLIEEAGVVLAGTKERKIPNTSSLTGSNFK